MCKFSCKRFLLRAWIKKGCERCNDMMDVIIAPHILNTVHYNFLLMQTFFLDMKGEIK